MNIALFHNFGASGAKRALYEHARNLYARGHRLSLYVPSASLDAEYLSLAPFCEAIYEAAQTPPSPVSGAANSGEGRARRAFRRLFGSAAHDMIRDLMGTRRRERTANALAAIYARMGADMARNGHDLIYAHLCSVFHVPTPLFRAICAVNGPAIAFYCQDTLRTGTEWPLSAAPEYDLKASTSLQRRRLGRFVTPIWQRWQERQEENYETGVRIADLTIVNSFYSREGVLRTTGISPRVCYLGVDSAFFRPDPILMREREVLSVGALRPEKRHEFVLEAVAQIPQERRPRLRIIGYEWNRGEGYADRLSAQAKAQGVELIVETEVTDARLREAYQRCAAVAFAPYLEPFGLVTLEAMACGTPVVGVAEGGLRESVREGETGLLTDRVPAEFGAALDAIVNDSERAAQMGAQGRADVCRNWTWERSTDQLEKCFSAAQENQRAREIRR